MQIYKLTCRFVHVINYKINIQVGVKKPHFYYKKNINYEEIVFNILISIPKCWANERSTCLCAILIRCQMHHCD